MPESPIALLRAHARQAPWNARGLAAHVTALAKRAAASAFQRRINCRRRAVGSACARTGQRDRAINEYRLVTQTRDNTGGAQELAQKYMSTAYKEGG